MESLIINTDGGARGNPGPAGIGVVFSNAQGQVLSEFKKYIGETTNNVAEYKALILGLEQALSYISENKHDLKNIGLKILMDSELIVRQMQGIYKIKDPGLKVLAAEVLKLKNNFKIVEFFHIPRAKNSQADKLVNEALDAYLETGSR